MAKSLFFTGTILKNNRNLLEEEATRQTLALQKEELDLRREQLADQRKKARAEGNKSLYKELSIEGAERYADYFSLRQQQIDDYTAENSELIRDNPNSAESRELVRLQRQFRADVNSAVNRGSLLNTHNNLKLQNKADSYLMLDDNSMFLYENLENQFVQALKDGTDFNEALGLYDIGVDNVLRKTPNTPVLNYINGKLDERSQEYEGDVKLVKFTDDQIGEYTDDIANKLRVNPNGDWSDQQYKNLYLNGVVQVVDLEGNITKVNSMDAFFQEEKGIGIATDSQKQELLPMLDLNNDGIAETVNENFNEALSNEYAKYLAEKRLEEVIPPDKRQEPAPDEGGASETEYFTMPDNVKTQFDENVFPDNERQKSAVVNGIEYNSDIQDKAGGDVEISLVNLMDGEVNQEVLYDELAQTSRDINMRAYINLKKKKAEGSLTPELKKQYNEILDKLKNSSAKGKVTQVSLDRNGTPIAIIKFEGSNRRVVVRLKDITSSVKGIYSGTTKKQPGTGYYIYLQAGGAAEQKPGSNPAGPYNNTGTS